MPKKPTTADAELILKLYDARREAEIRKARQWFAGAFWPTSADDVLEVTRGTGQENAWYRQVLGYWNMASSFVIHGALNENLFLETAFCGEMYFIYAKLQPFLKELRDKMQNPLFLANIEKLIMRSKTGRERLAIVARNVEARRNALAEAAKAKAS
ncbi:MAG TPA: hypothetical protein VNY29_17595 [Terriglobales bacterium]|jgi:hypothetical protein|nr:hypothetical protein [Terriglobales bacterium]